MFYLEFDVQNTNELIYIDAKLDVNFNEIIFKRNNYQTTNCHFASVGKLDNHNNLK